MRAVPVPMPTGGTLVFAVNSLFYLNQVRQRACAVFEQCSEAASISIRLVRAQVNFLTSGLLMHVRYTGTGHIVPFHKDRQDACKLQR